MLESLRRLLRRGPRPLDLSPLRTWADEHRCRFHVVHDGEGCWLERDIAHPAWRIEWGPSQRDYITGPELRIIGEVGTPKDLTALVLTRELMALMEKRVFEQYVEDVQTRLDAETPPEMRWLVMYTKLASADLGRLRDRYAALASLKDWAHQWLGGSLNDALFASLELVDDSQPMVLALARGRLTLRTAMADVESRRLAMWLTIFERAQSEAMRLSQEWQSSADCGCTTQPAAWPKSALSAEDD